MLIEAMAAGLPVIASRVGGIPALVDHDVNGLLVPPGDAAALAAAISRVLTEPGTAARLAAAARQTAQQYTWPALAPPGRRGLPAGDRKTAASLSRVKPRPTAGISSNQTHYRSAAKADVHRKRGDA